MLFIFKTNATMKPHNKGKYWISSGIIREKRIEADGLSNAIKAYAEWVEDENYITISKNAIKSRRPMYRNTKDGSEKQIGFIFTAQSEFNNDYKPTDKCWVKQYIDLWVEIITVVETNFEAA